MTAPAVIVSGVGARSLTVFEINSSGYIAAASTSTVYEGVDATGLRSLDITDPQPRFITHVGDDSPFALDILPPLEAMTGQVVISKQNDTLDAVLTGIKSFTVGEAKGFAFGTNLRGFENTMGAIIYQQGEVTDPTSATYGSRVWISKVFPRVVFFPLESGFNGNPEARTYALRPGFVTEHLWGTTLTTATEGVTRAQGFRFITQYKPKLVGWIGDNTEDEFLFPTDAPAVATGKIAVWLDGVPRTTNITLATTGITFTTSLPGVGVNITVLYEIANTAV